MVAWDALDALSHQFELCKIDSATRVAVVVDDTSRPEHVTLTATALQRSQATALEVRVIAHGAEASTHDLLPSVLESADVIITTGETRPELLTATNQLLHLANISPETFASHVNLRRRTHHLHETVRTATMMTIEDTNGTALRVDLAGGLVAGDHGLIDENHRRATFPAGWVAVTPAATRVSGDLVLMPGDANHETGRLIGSPVRLRIIDDHVAEIQGDSGDADLVRAVFEYANDPAAYGIAEVSIGLNPGPPATGVFDDRLLDPVISRLLAGTVTISFGENLVADRPANQHVTFALPARSVTVDDLVVCRAGVLQGDVAPDIYEL